MRLQWQSVCLSGRAICQLRQEEDDAPRVSYQCQLLLSLASNRKKARERKHQLTVSRCCCLYRNLIWCMPLIAITETVPYRTSTWLAPLNLDAIFAVLPALLITFHAILLFLGCCAFLSTGKKSIRSMRQVFLLFAVGDWYLLSLSHLSIEQSSGGKEKSSHAEISLHCSLLNPPSPPTHYDIGGNCQWTSGYCLFLFLYVCLCQLFNCLSVD